VTVKGESGIVRLFVGSFGGVEAMVVFRWWLGPEGLYGGGFSGGLTGDLHGRGVRSVAGVACSDSRQGGAGAITGR